MNLPNNNRIKELESLIKQHIKLYYTNSDNTVSNTQFDSWIDELTELAPESPVLLLMEENLGDYPKVKLPYRLYSQKKLKDLINLANWIKDVKSKVANFDSLNQTLVITPKFDGIHLMEAAKSYFTRGEKGIEGFDVSSRVDKLDLGNSDEQYAFGGELICSISNFKNYFEPQGYTSPRNLIQALFSNKEENLPIYLDKIDYIRYSIYSHENLNKVSQLSICNKNNKIQVKYAICSISDLTEEYLDSLFNEWKELYKIDGLVIEFDNPFLRNQLGYLTKYPQFSRAYKPDKYNQELKLAKINNIRWQLSRYGKLAPVAEIDPVRINDGNVTNASLYNARYVEDNNVYIGKKGYIYRAGAINPKFESFIKEEPEDIAQLPECCPFCKGSLEWDENKVDLYCLNENCKEKVSQQINFFFKTLGIKDFGLETIRTFIFEGDFVEIKDFLNFNKLKSTSVSGVGLKTKESFIEQLNDLKEKGVSLEKLQEASGLFDGLASQTLKILNAVNIDIEYLYKDSYYNIKLKELNNLKEVGEITAQSYLYSLPKFWNLYYRELVNFFPIKKKNNQIGNKFENINVVFTGFRDSHLKQIIEDNGGKVLSSVSKNCTYIVTKEKGDTTSSKAKKGIELNLPLISLEEFKNKFDI